MLHCFYLVSILLVNQNFIYCGKAIFCQIGGEKNVIIGFTDLAEVTGYG